MSESGQVIVVGMGEVGRPLFQILSRSYNCVPVDLEPVESSHHCSVLHICYPFQISSFIETTLRYIEKYQPALTIIHSTVAPGTTDRIANRSNSMVSFSPVRGKHAKMEQDMLFYAKFVGANHIATTQSASDHLQGAGFKTAIFPSAEAGEVAKLLETTWLGVLVGWAQDVERIAAQYGASYDEVSAFVREIAYLPKGIFPGAIGGHCVMPNIAILRSCLNSDFLDAVVRSNEQKLAESNLALECAAK